MYCKHCDTDIHILLTSFILHEQHTEDIIIFFKPITGNLRKFDCSYIVVVYVVVSENIAFVVKCSEISRNITLAESY